MNVWKRLFPVRTHEGAVAQKVDAKSELRRTVLTCLLWEDTFYEKGSDIAKRIAALAAETKPEAVAALAHEARDKMQLVMSHSSWCANSRSARARARSWQKHSSR